MTDDNVDAGPSSDLENPRHGFADGATRLPAITSVREIGRLIRSHRKAAGISQQELADLFGVGRRFVSELENGKPTVAFGLVLKWRRPLASTSDQAPPMLTLDVRIDGFADPAATSSGAMTGRSSSPIGALTRPAEAMPVSMSLPLRVEPFSEMRQRGRSSTICWRSATAR